MSAITSSAWDLPYTPETVFEGVPLLREGECCAVVPLAETIYVSLACRTQAEVSRRLLQASRDKQAVAYRVERRLNHLLLYQATEAAAEDWRSKRGRRHLLAFQEVEPLLATPGPRLRVSALSEIR